MQPTIDQLIAKIRHLPPSHYEMADKMLDYIATHPMNTEHSEQHFWQLAGMEAMWRIWDNDEDAIYDTL